MTDVDPRGQLCKIPDGFILLSPGCFGLRPVLRDMSDIRVIPEEAGVHCLPCDGG